jgi:hypothetical protein
MQRWPHRSRIWILAVLPAVLLAVGCEPTGRTTGPGAEPPPPLNLDGYYYARAVHLSWDLHPQWDGQTFRVYGKRVTDEDFFMIAEVTSCSDGRCTYVDLNVAPGITYEFYVASVSSLTGREGASEYAVEVFVPQPVPPPVPGSLDAVPLDGAIFLKWDDRSRGASDFSFYRVYLEGEEGESFLLGETDSEGFLDLLVENGNSYGYFVTAVDDQGHESDGSPLAVGAPRPDFHGELVYAFEDRAELSGFRFQESEAFNPIVSGTDPNRHFRLEADETGWWLVPGPGVQLHREGYFTTQLRCGPAADDGCTDIRQAPASNYSGDAMSLVPEYAYVLRTPADDGGWRYGVIRVSHVGWTQDGAIVIFDWAFQLQVNNRALLPG